MQMDILLGRDDDHEVGHHPIRPLGPVGLPVRKVRNFDQHWNTNAINAKCEIRIVQFDVGDRNGRKCFASDGLVLYLDAYAPRADTFWLWPSLYCKSSYGHS